MCVLDLDFGIGCAKESGLRGATRDVEREDGRVDGRERIPGVGGTELCSR
jgi:hypothetical protein